MKVLKMLNIDEAAALAEISRGNMEALVRSGAVRAFNLGSASTPRYFLRRESLMECVCKGEKDFSRGKL